MLSLSDPRTNNPVLASLQIKPSDKLISIKEGQYADSNFILTHLIKQILHEKNKFVLIGLHNTLDHYQNVGRKLGYDVKKVVSEDQARIIEPIEELAGKIIEDAIYRSEIEIIKCLYDTIDRNIRDLLKNTSEQLVYVIIDDLSHLLDLGVQIDSVVNFIQNCNNFADSDRIVVVINTHVCNNIDEIISNTLQYTADVHIDISALKTGISADVTGVMTVERLGLKSCYQYKSYDRGVKTFHPGESIYHLQK